MDLHSGLGACRQVAEALAIKAPEVAAHHRQRFRALCSRPQREHAIAARMRDVPKRLAANGRLAVTHALLRLLLVVRPRGGAHRVHKAAHVLLHVGGGDLRARLGCRFVGQLLLLPCSWLGLLLLPHS